MADQKRPTLPRCAEAPIADNQKTKPNPAISSPEDERTPALAK